MKNMHVKRHDWTIIPVGCRSRKFQTCRRSKVVTYLCSGGRGEHPPSPLDQWPWRPWPWEEFEKPGSDVTSKTKSIRKVTVNRPNDLSKRCSPSLALHKNTKKPGIGHQSPEIFAFKVYLFSKFSKVAMLGVEYFRNYKSYDQDSLTNVIEH